MDYAMLPPEINSARMYSGPGPGSMLAAASAWGELAGELGPAALSYSSVISGLTGASWLGPSSTAMATAAAPYVTWLHSTARQAEESANQARAAAGAYESAFAMTVPPPLIAANRTQLASLIATNVLGQNAPAIATTEAQYGEMWAQDADAMYGYAGSSAAAATVTPFNSPPGRAHTQPETAMAMSTVPAALQGLTSPASSTSSTSPLSSMSALAIPARFATYPLTFLMRALSFGKAGAAPGAAAASSVKAAESGLAASLASTANPFGGPAVSATLGGSASLGPMSVPTSWSAVGAATPAPAPPPVAGASVVPPEGTTGVPPMMPITNMAGRAATGATPQYDMRPSVIPRTPAAG